MAGWQDRKGVEMWVIANYAMGFSGIGSKLKELRSTCQEALAGLPHDHCARYLAYREAEACALLGDRKGFLECWSRHREYFDGKLEEGEWFEAKRRYLMADLPALARFLENNEIRNYRAQLRRLRWEGFKLSLPSARVPNGSNVPNGINWRWLWWVIWLLIVLLSQLFRDSN
jgi:hypothetical protein